MRKKDTNMSPAISEEPHLYKMVGDLNYKIVSFNMRSAGEYQEVVTLKVVVLTNLDGIFCNVRDLTNYRHPYNYHTEKNIRIIHYRSADN
jgi:hypothetical protein